MSKCVVLVLALLGFNCIAQGSKYEAECSEKVRAYNPDASLRTFEALVRQCISINEYEERRQKQAQRLERSRANDREFDRIAGKADLLIKLIDLETSKRAEGVADSEIGSCIDTKIKKPTKEDIEAAIICLNALQKK